MPMGCCMPDDPCDMLDPLCCVQATGHPVDGTCTMPMACCMQDNTCEMLDPLCCLYENGDPVGGSCTTLVGCCLPGGECQDLDPLCCMNLAGIPHGTGGLCEDTIACCFDMGSMCRDLEPECCLIEDGWVSPYADHCLGDLNENGINDACEDLTPCFEDADCYDGDYCTSDHCIGGWCAYTPILSRPYADVYNVPDGDGAVEIMDTLCVLDAASGIGECLTDVGGYMIGDIHPCWPPEGTGPDGAVEIMDTLAVLDAASGNPACSSWCPPGRLGGYSNGPCVHRSGERSTEGDRSAWCLPDEVEYTVVGNTIEVVHRNATYTCDEVIVHFSLTVQGNLLRLVETEEVIVWADCYCCYMASATIENLAPGTYTVELCWWDNDYAPPEYHCYSAEVVVP